MAKINDLYHPEQVESDVQAIWDERDAFTVIEDDKKDAFYCLSMLPYPSGSLHVGHVRNYTIGDVISRFQRMQGKNVLQPIGWDAFGLPAENAALKHKVPPAKWTYENIVHMRAQLKRLGYSYDWKREITTCDPQYYRWEQWLFLKMYEKGLVYKKKSIVNWDPVDHTVLANEQVIDGCGWRSGAKIERREMPQWFLKITDYADELISGLDELEGWPEQVRTMQKNWIGRSEGVNFNLVIQDCPDIALSVYTTRIDTIMGLCYLAIAPEHPLAQYAANHNDKIKQFIKTCKHSNVAEADLATMEKIGIDSGFKAIHPLTHEKLPIWIANYVLMDYGTGAVMAVPAHDERDFEFAKKYHLPKKIVISSKGENQPDYESGAFTEKGVLINSNQYDGLTSIEAIKKIADDLIEKNQGQREIHYRLRDWGVSRQRYWGAPIPMIECKQCGDVPVPESALPVILPEGLTPEGAGSPLNHMPDFYEVQCPQCHQMARRETDTFDTFIESSWYFLRYTCPDQNEAMLDDRAQYWSPVNQYIGGIEHAVLHLLYARFFHKVIRDLGLVQSNEPFTRLLTQGMVLKDGTKMSKSKGNTVDPQALIEQYGADTVRLFIMFAAPPEQALEWSDKGVEGAYRYLKRLWKLISGFIPLTPTDSNMVMPLRTHLKDSRRLIHETIQKVTDDLERRYAYNTAIAALMTLTNHLTELDETDKNTLIVKAEGIEVLLKLLSPFIPHLTQALWAAYGHSGLIMDAPWPKVDLNALIKEELTIVIQINGKKRGQIDVPVQCSEEDLKQLALKDEKIIPFLENKTIKKMIVVPSKLINIVAC